MFVLIMFGFVILVNLFIKIRLFFVKGEKV